MSDNNASGLHIDAAIADAVNGALMSMNPILLAYADAEGQPHLSYRGTAQTFSDDQLAVWARDANGGLPTALSKNPRVTLLYRNPETRTMYIFYGQGHVVTDEATRNHIFDASPEREQQTDPERKGAAIVIDLDKIEGRTADGPFSMTRS